MVVWNSGVAGCHTGWRIGGRHHAKAVGTVFCLIVKPISFGFEVRCCLHSGLTKSGQGDEAADSTDSTEPIHLVLQHLRESFSLS